jgi:hypothetical protein
MLASVMVVLLLPGSASGYIPSQDFSVGFKGTLFNGSWDTERFQFRVADGRLLDDGEKGGGDPGQVVTFGGSYQDSECEWWQFHGADRFDADFPFAADTGSLNVVLSVVAEHYVLPVHSGPELCEWESPPLVHEHFSGTVATHVVLTPPEKCPKKGPNSGCSRSNSVSGTFTVELDTTETNPFDGQWASGDFEQTGWFDSHYNGTLWWIEPIIPPPGH